LLPRLLLPGILALVLLLPAIQGALDGHFRLAGQMPLGATGTLIAGGLASVTVGGLLFALFTELPPDPRFQAGMGQFPGSALHSHSSRVGEDWPHVGGDPGGTRYTPLDQITPGNVANLEVAWQV